jgi:hypothetical protein
MTDTGQPDIIPDPEAADWYVIVPGSPWGGKTGTFGPYPEGAARDMYARLVKPFVPECPPKLLRVVEDYALAERCNCVISGGPVLPPCCRVHGIPCEVCGGVQSCLDDCGEVAR